MTVRKARLMADDIGTLKCSFVQNKSAPLLFQTLNFGRPNGGPPLVMDLHFVPGLPLVRTSNYEGSSRVHDRKQAGHEGFRDAMQLEWRSYLRATFDLGSEHIRFSLRPKAATPPNMSVQSSADVGSRMERTGTCLATH